MNTAVPALFLDRDDTLVRDAGYTEFHGEPTYTCLAFEPLAPEQIDPITGDLPLY